VEVQVVLGSIKSLLDGLLVVIDELGDPGLPFL
jgi:hypothetical protein